MLSFVACKQQRCSPAWASVQNDEHLCHLLSGKYITAKFALCKVSKFKLVSVAKQPSLSLTLSEAPDRFSLQEAYFRNEFNFLYVHGIMNTLVLLLSK